MTVRFYRHRIAWPACSGHSRPGGNGLSQPLDSGLRRNDERVDSGFHRTKGLLGGLFPAPLYHPALAGTPPEEGNWNYLGRLFQTRLYHGSAELAERPTSL